MRLIFAGTPEVAVPSLRLLAQEHAVTAVLTRPDAPGKRGKKLYPSPVAQAAEELGIPVYKTASIRDDATQEFIRAHAPEAIAVVAYGALVPAEALDIPTHGWINLHFSLLPAYRGAAPVQRSLQAGDTEGGVSVFRIDAGLDTGPLLAQQAHTLPPAAHAGEVLEMLAQAGAPLLSATLRELAAGTVVARPQPSDGISHAPQLTPAEGRVQWGSEAAAICAHIRGFTPDPGAWTRTSDGVRVKIIHARVATRDSAADLPPGAFTLAGKQAVVGTGEGTVELVTVAPAGKKPMDGAAWLRGYRGAMSFEVDA